LWVSYTDNKLMDLLIIHIEEQAWKIYNVNFKPWKVFSKNWSNGGQNDKWISDKFSHLMRISENQPLIPKAPVTKLQNFNPAGKW